MSYLVEVSKEDHKNVLRNTLTVWGKQELDVQLVSSEGHKVSASKVLLSLYSSQLRSVLNQPEIAFSSSNTCISVPASSSTISSLLSVLSAGSAGSSSREALGDLKSLAQVLGINIKNCFAENKKSSSGGVTLLKLPVKSETLKTIPVIKSKPLTLKTIPSPISLPVKKTVVPVPSPSVVTKVIEPTSTRKLNTSIINKSSKLRIELKEVSEEIPLVNPVGKTESAEPSYPTCEVCQKQFKDKRYLSRHRYRKHGLKKRDRQAGEIQVKVENVSNNQCSVCQKVYQSQELLDLHFNKRHAPKKKHQCDICKKFSKTRGELKMHMLTHLPESERPYKCDFCEKRFCQKGQKNIHMKKYHPEGEAEQEHAAMDEKDVSSSNSTINDETINEETIPVDNSEVDPFADSESITESFFIENVESLEVIEDSCGYCGEKFENENDLNLHIIDFHG